MFKINFEIDRDFNGYVLTHIKSEFDNVEDYFNVHAINVKLNNLVCELNEEFKKYNEMLERIKND